MNKHLFLLLFLLGCRSETPPVVGTALVDDLGRTVVVALPAQRVLSLAPSNTELVFALGGGHRLVGRSDACDFPAEVAGVPSVGGLFPPDLERILLKRPDLVLMIEGHTELRTGLEARGVPVLVLQPRTVEGVFANIRLLARALGVPAEPLEGRLRAEVEAVKPVSGAPPVLYEVWPKPLTSAGPGTFVGDLLRRAGAQNVVPAELGDWPAISLETVVRARPVVIIAASAESAKNILAGERPGLSQTPAAQAGRVHVVPNPDWLVRPGPRMGQGLAWLAEVLRTP